MSETIAPHGGVLVQRTAGDEAEAVQQRAAELPQLTLSVRETYDFEMIAIGAFSPLEGYMRRADYENTVLEMRLANGLPWTIPVTLAASAEEAKQVEAAGAAALFSTGGTLLGTVERVETFGYDKTREAKNVFLTTEEAHPGVAELYAQKETLIGGEIRALRFGERERFEDAELPPAAARAAFAERGWKRVVAFQTRNPIHRAHEYIIKTAMETADGLFLHPLVGWTQKGDIPAEVRMECYRTILKHYFPADRVLLGSMPAAMRYAGPREAVLHALVRKNYGCAHFIVGRDHAGVGNYYGTYDAQRIFDQFEPGEIGIEPMRFEHAFYCPRTNGMATAKTSPSAPIERVFLSGTKVREMLANGEPLPPEFTRKEISDLLSLWAQSEKA